MSTSWRGRVGGSGPPCDSTTCWNRALGIGGRSPTADVFSEDEYFENSCLERACNRTRSVAGNALVLYYCEMGIRPVVSGGNASYVIAASEINSDVSGIVGRRVFGAVIGLPE